MIPFNFSISRNVADFISINRESKDFFKRELITRIAGISLSIFSCIDFLAHCMGAIEKSITNDSSAIKHLQCMEVFLEAIPSASLEGFILPEPRIFSLIEHKRTASVCGLLLSRQSKYFKDSHMDPLDFLIYLETLSTELPEQEGMKETLELLQGAKELHKNFDRLYRQKTFIEGGLTRSLSSAIKKLIQNNPTIFKACLAHLLSLGLSFTAALDLIGNAIFLTCHLLFIFILDSIFLKGKLMDRDLKELGTLFLYHLRDLFLTLPGILAGSLTGLINPLWGLEIANPSSPFYNEIRYNNYDISEKIITNIKLLEEGKSLLVPLTIHGEGVEISNGHIVYLLVTRNKGYSLSVFNKGGGSEQVLKILSVEMGEKIPIHLTVNSLSFDETCKYIHEMIYAVTLSSQAIEDLNQQYQENVDIFSSIMHTIYSFGRENPDKISKDLLKAKPQLFGDCPKASLLGALHYHSHCQNGNSQPYKLFLKNIKKHAVERDGHLMDIALSLPKRDEKPSEFIRKKLSNF